jgi:cell division inhibitor SepF
MGFVDAIKDFIGIETEEYEDYEEEAVVDEKPVSMFSKKSKVVPISGNSMQPKIVIVKPRSFNNTNEIADELKSRRPVIFDVGGLEPDEARRVVDYIAGTVYGIDGDIKRVSGGIFIAVPAQIDVAGRDLEESRDTGFEWTMI